MGLNKGVASWMYEKGGHAQANIECSERGRRRRRWSVCWIWREKGKKMEFEFWEDSIFLNNGQRNRMRS